MKIKNIFLKIALILLIICILFALFLSPGFQTSKSDLFLYRMSGVCLFLFPLIGIVIELDFKGIKERIPGFRNKKAFIHIISWVFVIVFSLLFFGIINSFLSSDFKENMRVLSAQRKENRETIETSETVETNAEIIVETITPTEMTTIVTPTTVDIPTPTPTITQVVAETSSPTPTPIPIITPQLIVDETYYLQDCVYTVNGVQVYLDSIRLKQEAMTYGYSLELTYRLANNNNTSATFELSSIDGNGFYVDEQLAMLSVQVASSNRINNFYSLGAEESTDDLYSVLFAASRATHITQNGVDYYPINIENIYTDQNISVSITFSVRVDDEREYFTAELELNK